MKMPSLREIQATAASVAGARAVGAETAASQAAPAILAAAETELDCLLQAVADAEPSAPDQAAEARYSELAEKAASYAATVDELRAAMGMETHAAARDREAIASRAKARAEWKRARRVRRGNP